VTDCSLCGCVIFNHSCLHSSKTSCINSSDVDAGTFQSVAMSSVWLPSSTSAGVQLPVHQPASRQPMFTNVTSSAAVQSAANPPLQPVPLLSPTADAAAKLDFQQFSSGLFNAATTATSVTTAVTVAIAITALSFCLTYLLFICCLL